MKCLVHDITFEYDDEAQLHVNTRSIEVADEDEAEARMEAGEFNSYLIPELFTGSILGAKL